MEIPTHELQAFRSVAKALNFSIAAERIHITQSALSQRIQSLERRLEVTLMIRSRRGVALTDAGLKLLRYCQAKDHLDADFLNDLVPQPNGKLSGVIRLAGYSSVLRSVIMPALAALLNEHPAIHFEFNVVQTRELPSMLQQGKADYVVMDHYYENSDVKTHLLGEERYVHVRSISNDNANVYLDHDNEDNISISFVKKLNKENLNMRRSYVNDIYGVIQGIQLGIGQGIVPIHLIQGIRDIKVVCENEMITMPIVLHYYQQPYYSKLHYLLIESLINHCKQYL